jgi:hypothetical protein
MPDQQSLRGNLHRFFGRKPTLNFLKIQGVARYDEQTIGVGPHVFGWNLSQDLRHGVFHWCSYHRFCDEDWDETLGFALVFLIRRIGCYRDLPESFSLN